MKTKSNTETVSYLCEELGKAHKTVKLYFITQSSWRKENLLTFTIIAIDTSRTTAEVIPGEVCGQVTATVAAILTHPLLAWIWLCTYVHSDKHTYMQM